MRSIILGFILQIQEYITPLAQRFHSTAHQLLKLIDQSNLIVIEDDIFSDFEYTPAPRLAALDNLSRVIFIGSFSKTLSASIRCGYIIAKPEWIDQITDLKLLPVFLTMDSQPRFYTQL